MLVLIFALIYAQFLIYYTGTPKSNTPTPLLAPAIEATLPPTFTRPPPIPPAVYNFSVADILILTVQNMYEVTGPY